MQGRAEITDCRTSGQEGLDYLGCGRQDGDVCRSSSVECAPGIVNSHELRRVARGCGDRRFEAGSGELYEVLDATVERKDASCQRTVGASGGATSVVNLDLHVSEQVGSVGHAGCAHAVGDEDDSVFTLCFEEQAHHDWVDMDSVADDFGEERRLVEDISGNSRLTMV